MLSEIRNEHWIIQGRSAVRRMIRQCLICIFWEGGPFKTPRYSPSPNYVTSNANMKPFIFVGVKIRAIYPELVVDMATDSSLMCLRRFMARRGKSEMMISDNANQFRLG